MFAPSPRRLQFFCLFYIYFFHSAFSRFPPHVSMKMVFFSQPTNKEFSCLFLFLRRCEIKKEYNRKSCLEPVRCSCEKCCQCKSTGARFWGSLCRKQNKIRRRWFSENKYTFFSLSRPASHKTWINIAPTSDLSRHSILKTTSPSISWLASRSVTDYSPYAR